MTNQDASARSRNRLAIIIMVVAFAVLSWQALTLPVLESESVNVWLTDDAVTLTGGSLREAARGLVDNLQLLVERVRISPYMPLHSVILDVWRWPVKDNLLLMRALSVGFFVAGLWVTYRLCRRLAAPISALLALIVVLTFSYTPVIGASTTPFALLFLLGALIHWALLHWLESPTLARLIVYFLALTGAIFTHAAALLLITLHALVLLARIWRALGAEKSLEALSDANEKIGLLWWMLTAGFSSAAYWLWVTFITGEAVVDLPLQANLLPALMALLLPVIAVSVALFLKRTEQTRWFSAYASLALVLALASWMFAPHMPDWSRVTSTIMSERLPTEPLVYTYQPYSALAYLDRDGQLSGGIALDLSWRDYQQGELEQMADSLTRGGLPVWFIADAQSAHLETLWMLITTEYGYVQTATAFEPVAQVTLMGFARP